METKNIKVFGERNCGTNYVTQLVKKNFEVNVLPGTVPDRLIWKLSETNKNLYFKLYSNKCLGWKHSRPDSLWLSKNELFRSTKFVTVTKNPYSFLLSLYDRPYHYKGPKPGSFEKFLKSPWKVQTRDNLKVSELKNPIELWNIKNRSYLSLKRKSKESVYNLKYEKLVENHSYEIGQISGLLNESLNGSVINHKDSTKERNKSFDYYKDYYLNERWRSKLDDKLIKLINDSLDLDTVAEFGYNKIN